MPMKKGEERRNTILEIAEKLFYTKGYEATSVQDIIDALQISKGGFYHHFESKLSLLEAIAVQRSEDSFQRATQAIDECPGTAVDKLNVFFEMNGVWQQNSLEYIGLLLRVTIRQDSIFMREKMKQISKNRQQPLINDIIMDGVQKGLFFSPYPDGMAEIILELSNALTEQISQILVSSPGDGDELMRILEKLELYRHSIERLLDAPHGSIVIYKMERMAVVCQAIIDQNRRLSWENYEKNSRNSL